MTGDMPPDLDKLRELLGDLPKITPEIEKAMADAVIASKIERQTYDVTVNITSLDGQGDPVADEAIYVIANTKTYGEALAKAKAINAEHGEMTEHE